MHHHGCIPFSVFLKGVFDVIVNGEEIKLESLCTVSELVTSLGYRPELIAIELNGEILPKKEYASTALEDTDVMEIVMFMGGGSC